MRSNKDRLRGQADTLLQTYIKLKYKDCLVCGNPLYCGHHFFTKASSNALRYYIPNIIPICLECHCKVHTQPHLVEPIICFKLGQAWYEDLIEVKRLGVKANVEWYEANIKGLSDLTKELGGGECVN